MLGKINIKITAFGKERTDVYGRPYPHTRNRIYILVAHALQLILKVFAEIDGRRGLVKRFAVKICGFTAAVIAFGRNHSVRP